MRFGPQASPAAHELKRLFKAMDAADNDGAVQAMQRASALLRENGSSFRQLIQTIEAQQLLMPSKIATALQMVDSNNVNEAENSFLGARRLMKSCGLSFDQIITALQADRNAPAGIDPLHHEVTRLKNELVQLQNESARLKTELSSQTSQAETLRREVARLQADTRRYRLDPMPLPLKVMFVVFFGLCCAYLATHTALFIAELFSKPKTVFVIRPAPVPTPPTPAPAPSPPPAIVPPTLPSPPAPGLPDMAQPAPLLQNSSRAPECWRDRSVRGPCFPFQ